MRLRSLITAVLTLAIASAATDAQNPRDRELTPAEQVAHALSRLTFGARPGDLERVAAVGVDQWIEQQLHPASVRDTAVVTALSSLRSWTLEPRTLSALAVTTDNVPASTMRFAPDMQMGDSARVTRYRPVSYTSASNEFVTGKIIRAQLSERQLEEVMADFWLNHFSVYSGKMPSIEAIVVWERDVIRPRTLGKFRDLLGAVAHSPAMLFYLDNQGSRSDSLHRTLTEFRAGKTPSVRGAATKRLGINENYARELLELHTLGVDGGYTQHDVIEVARALTGWSTTLGGAPVARRTAGDPVSFVFVDDMHDAEAKTVLGHALAEGRGTEDGEQVLDIIARHPSTARFIATKLARRFVSDSPPPALIDRAAATFTRTDGDITETLRTIVTSPEFFSRAAFRSKVKTPFEFLVSVRRALNAPADTSVASARLVAQLGQPTLGHLTPEGWPDIGSAWANSGAMLERIVFTTNVAAGRLKFLPTAGWDGWRLLASAPIERQVDGVIGLILGGHAEQATRDLMLATATPASSAPGGTVAASRLRELLGIALGSPEFQRR
jgi:uncharacterized protein (DUF1800 family)